MTCASPTPTRARWFVSTAVRLDKWLWAARFFKTRSLAAQAIGGGKDLEAGKEVTLLDRQRGFTRIRLKARFLTDAEAKELAAKQPDKK